MGAILKSLRALFSRPLTSCPPPESIDHIPTDGLCEVSRHSDGLFSFLLGDSGRAALKRDMGFSVAEIEPLAARVFEKCRELGFWHGDKVHFVLCPHEREREVEWTTGKIIPPILLAKGEMAERSIAVYMPTLRAEVENAKRDVVEGVLKVGRFVSEDLKQEYLAKTILPKFKAKHSMLLTHEMIHIFATDEYYPIMDVLGLERLERLTDAINVVTFYPDYKGSGDWEKSGFVEGCAYILNSIFREQPHLHKPSQLLELCHQSARRIIKECKALLNKHETGKSTEKGVLERV